MQSYQPWGAALICSRLVRDIPSAFVLPPPVSLHYPEEMLPPPETHLSSSQPSVVLTQAAAVAAHSTALQHTMPSLLPVSLVPPMPSPLLESPAVAVSHPLISTLGFPGSLFASGQLSSVESRTASGADNLLSDFFLSSSPDILGEPWDLSPISPERLHSLQLCYTTT